MQMLCDGCHEVPALVVGTENGDLCEDCFEAFKHGDIEAEDNRSIEDQINSEPEIDCGED